MTTCVDTGSAGPGNFAGFRQHVIEPSAVRILAYLHVSHAGIFGFSREVHVGEGEDVRLMDPVGRRSGRSSELRYIIGIKVRVGRHASGDQGITPLEYALQTAEEAGLPLMAHIDEPPPSYEDVIARLRPGDVLTHAFRPFPNAPCTVQGTIKPAVLRARERGVLFDIGHGMGSFAFKTARAMLANGFLPDTISSDIHALCIDGPARSRHHHVEVPLPWVEPERYCAMLHGNAGVRRSTSSAWHIETGRSGRCHSAHGGGGALRLYGCCR